MLLTVYTQRPLRSAISRWVTDMPSRGKAQL